MFLMFVPPIPVGPLLLPLEVFELDIGLVLLFPPSPVHPIFAIVPFVIVLVILVVYTPFFPLVPLMVPIILRP